MEYVKVRGNEALEIDVDNKVDEIYQDLPTRAGEVYKLTFDSVLKDTTSVGSGTVQVLWNGNVVATFDRAGPGQQGRSSSSAQAEWTGCPSARSRATTMHMARSSTTSLLRQLTVQPREVRTDR